VGMYVNAMPLFAVHWLIDWHNWGVIAQVAIGLGMVIFVHELGHFLVAKACGVKCEKFYLGFDIFGLKLARFRWGETEYGIGVLPLGGYVKMLGQEDNPAKAAEEMERAKLARTAADGDTLSEGEAAAETSIFDPRSYLAKSVPKRMAIISAGVIMNLIFAFVVAVIAYSRGVYETPCVVGSVLPGEPAWRAGLQPGDDIVQIRDVMKPRFRDLQKGVILGNRLEDGVQFIVRRAGEEKPIDLMIYPVRPKKGLAPRIGVGPSETTIFDDPPLATAVPLAGPDCPIRPGDVVEEIDGKKITTYADIKRQSVQNPGPMVLKIRRENEKGVEELSISVPPRPTRRMGLVMEIGPITAVQLDSPAAAAGLEPGDVFETIDGEPVGDPELLRGRIDALGGKTVEIAVRRNGTTLKKSVTLREPYAYELSFGEQVPVAITSLGAAFGITSRVAQVTPGSPAEKAGIAPGATIVAVEVIPPEKIPEGAMGVVRKKATIKTPLDAPNWPQITELLQMTLPGTKVKLTLSDEREFTVEPLPVDGEWYPDRGFSFKELLVEHKAKSFADAIDLGATEAVGSVTQVYQFLRKIGTQVSPLGMSGPLGILSAAHSFASKGFSDLLIFLCMLSANLAVLNFLPIPLLDGGHMLFLVLEGIRGKPVSERIIVAFHYVGFLFIISLMAFVFLLDLNVIPRTP